MTPQKLCGVQEVCSVLVNNETKEVNISTPLEEAVLSTSDKVSTHIHGMPQLTTPLDSSLKIGTMFGGVIDKPDMMCLWQHVQDVEELARTEAPPCKEPLYA